MTAPESRNGDGEHEHKALLALELEEGRHDADDEAALATAVEEDSLLAIVARSQPPSQKPSGDLWAAVRGLSPTALAACVVGFMLVLFSLELLRSGSLFRSLFTSNVPHLFTSVEPDVYPSAEPPVAFPSPYDRPQRPPAELVPDVDWDAVESLQRPGATVGDKWVVVTTINPPTPSVVALVALEGWNLVVVGDTKTPTDWQLEGAVFLGVEQQKTLGYRIHELLPYKSYARKSLGYLYAIQHGAQIIYETDDDNKLTVGSLEDAFQLDMTNTEQLLMYRESRNRVVNPYVHFGQPTMWPRGYPLDAIANNAQESAFHANVSIRPLIQQGLANGDPDVDAIFRLTRVTEGQLIRVHFDEDAPTVALPHGTMCPFNSQNTLFHRDALWGMLIPMTTSFRVCDIWRGYWAQRLLWDVGGHLSFHKPSVYQDRNVHDFFKDFVEERAMYEDAGALVTFLTEWESTKDHFFSRILDLSNAMAAEGYWGQKDAELTAAWLQDLIAVGYRPPKVVLHPNALGIEPEQVQFLSKDLPSSFLDIIPLQTARQQARDWVERPGKVPGPLADDHVRRLRAHFRDVVLIVNYNWPYFKNNLLWLRLVYSRIFETVVVQTEYLEAAKVVEAESMGVQLVEQGWQGWAAYRNLPDIFKRYPWAAGFMYINDDVALNYWTLLGADKSKIWYQKPLQRDLAARGLVGIPFYSNKWFAVDRRDRTNNFTDFSFWDQFRDAMEKLFADVGTELNSTFEKHVAPSQYVYGKSIADMYYIPQRHTQLLSELIPIFLKHGIWSEIALANLFLFCDSFSEWDPDALENVIYLWGVDRFPPPQKFWTPKAHGLHPWKLKTPVDILDWLNVMARGDPNL